jgi:hypothetical protein
VVSLQAAARAFALVEALRRQPQDPGLRGHVRDRFAPAGELTLIGCGYEVWQTPAGARGVTGHFYEPAGRRWLSAQLARAAGQDPTFVPEQAVQREAVWGSTLARLSVSEVTVRNAALSSAGRLSLSGAVRADLRPLALRRGSVRRWEGSFADWSRLDAFVRARLGPGLRRDRSTEVAVLLPQRTGRPVFDEIAQALVLPLMDRKGRTLALRVESQPHLARRILALQEILAATAPQAFFVSLALSGERLRISPYALLCDPDSPATPLDAPGTVERPQGTTGELAPLAHPEPMAVPSATLRLLTAALDALVGLCELGGHMQDPALLTRLRAVAQRLADSGLGPAAELVRRVMTAGEPQRPQAVLVAAHALDGLLTLLRLPIS